MIVQCCRFPFRFHRDSGFVHSSMFGRSSKPPRFPDKQNIHLKRSDGQEMHSSSPSHAGIRTGSSRVDRLAHQAAVEAGKGSMGMVHSKSKSNLHTSSWFRPDVGGGKSPQRETSLYSFDISTGSRLDPDKYNQIISGTPHDRFDINSSNSWRESTRDQGAGPYPPLTVVQHSPSPSGNTGQAAGGEEVPSKSTRKRFGRGRKVHRALTSAGVESFRHVCNGLITHANPHPGPQPDQRLPSPFLQQHEQVHDDGAHWDVDEEVASQQNPPQHETQQGHSHPTPQQQPSPVQTPHIQSRDENPVDNCTNKTGRDGDQHVHVKPAFMSANGNLRHSHRQVHSQHHTVLLSNNDCDAVGTAPMITFSTPVNFITALCNLQVAFAVLGSIAQSFISACKLTKHCNHCAWSPCQFTKCGWLSDLLSVVICALLSDNNDGTTQAQSSSVQSYHYTSMTAFVLSG